MFLKLTTKENKSIYINTSEIRFFEKYEDDNTLTVIYLKYGDRLVKQQPDEIMQMLKGSD